MNKAGHVLIGVLLVVNVMLYWYVFKSRRSSALYGDSSIQFPVPDGRLRDGNRATSSRDARCYIVRVGTEHCPYCRKDHDMYAQLVLAGVRVGCRPVSLSPTAAQKPEPIVVESEAQLTFVNFQFGRVLMPFGTPQTILINGTGHVLWEADGAMDNRKLDDGLRALRDIQ